MMAIGGNVIISSSYSNVLAFLLRRSGAATVDVCHIHS